MREMTREEAAAFLPAAPLEGENVPGAWADAPSAVPFAGPRAARPSRTPPDPADLQPDGEGPPDEPDEEDRAPADPEPALGWLECLREYAGNPPQARQTGVGFLIRRKTLQEYPVAPLENRIKAQFEAHVRRQAALAVAQLEEEVGPEEAAAYRAAYVADRGAGLYNWDGRHCRTARSDAQGLATLLFLLIRRCQPDVTEEEVQALCAEEPKQVVPVLRWALGNAPGPETAAPPLPGLGLTEEEKEHLRREVLNLLALRQAMPRKAKAPRR